MSLATPTTPIELPTALYRELEQIAEEEQSDPIELITSWVHTVRQRQAWQKGWDELRQQVQANPSPHFLLSGDISKDSELIVEQMRRTRQELFDAEYAHLYR